MEAYGTYWNMAEWEVRKENCPEHDRSRRKLLGDTTQLVMSHHSAGPGSPVTLTHMAVRTRVDF
jgi:hypothetical protein